MWVLDPPEVDDPDIVLDTALTYANGTSIYALTHCERAAIHAVYALYDAMLGQPHINLRPAELDGARSSLENAYGQIQKGARLEKLRDHLIAATDSCPYCGFGEPRDLDHYLPRSVYGELAIYPRNLIPSCGPCNNAKRTVIPGLGAAHGPGLIHAYFQELPDLDFLVADITFGEGALTVRFRIDRSEIDPTLADKLQFQLDRLKLNDRYEKQINKFISEQRTALLMLHELHPNLTGDYLARSALSLAQPNGRNDWRVALLRALSLNADFCAEPQLYVGDREYV